MSLAPSHHFIKIKILPDSPNVIFKILLLVRIHFCPLPSQEHFKLFILFFSSLQHCCIQPFRNIASHFQNSGQINFPDLKGTSDKRYYKLKNTETESSKDTPIMLFAFMLLCKLAQSKGSIKCAFFPPHFSCTCTTFHFCCSKFISILENLSQPMGCLSPYFLCSVQGS